MPFEAELRGPRGHHAFSTMRRHFVESGDINETAEALTEMLDPVEFMSVNAGAQAWAAVHSGSVTRDPRTMIASRVTDGAITALDSWNPMTYAERLWNRQLDDMAHHELMSAIVICLLDLRSRTSDLAFVITRYGPPGMFGGLFQVGRAHQTSVLHVENRWEPTEIGAKLVKKMRKVGLNDWGHLMALCQMLASYTDALSGMSRNQDRIAVGLNFYDL